MSDGSGGISEAVKGFVGGTATVIKNELKEAGKVAVQQTVKPLSSSPHPQAPGQPGQDAYKVADEQKKAQIRNRLHNELISSPRPSAQPNQHEQNGPIAARSFQNSSHSQQMQQIGSSKADQSNMAVSQAQTASETGRGHKG